VTPICSEDSAVDTSPTLQVNAVKVPSELMLTDLFKVTTETRQRGNTNRQKLCMIDDSNSCGLFGIRI
jgi:hypothetical protein